jgi:hypothetical protein
MDTKDTRKPREFKQYLEEGKNKSQNLYYSKEYPMFLLRGL